MTTQNSQFPNNAIQDLDYKKMNMLGLRKPKDEWVEKLENAIEDGYNPNNVKMLTVSFVKLIDNVHLAFKMVDHCDAISSIEGYYETVKLLICTLYALTDVSRDDCNRLKELCDKKLSLIVYKERIRGICERYKGAPWSAQINEPAISYNRENEYAYELLKINNLSGPRSLRESAYREISQRFKDLNYRNGFKNDLEHLRETRPDIPFRLYQGLSSNDPALFYKQCATYLRMENDNFILHKICSVDELYNMMIV
ncbi:hypothetical protein QK685_sRNA6agp1 [Perilla mosaic virus]|uniref:Uncharacterized protein n=1 Tax=Perilla mosaic virus TaxID=2483037 RepID=A0A6F8PH47_9VIRU|nr:hypothetical protein QK685_sRNA6agp1 [Perilla mosaic virus]BBM96183.1 hypothetical protein [Perilla mosaic virus]